MLPNFLVVGGNRCATTWIYECLTEHPNVYMSKIKQIHFFDLNYSKGINYYETFFNDADKNTYRAIGEASPSYLASPECAKRIKKNLPDSKIIAILRNPVERAFSQYVIFKENYDKIACSFEEAVKVKPALIDDGVYFKHLKRYYQFFDEKQILILLYDDLIYDQNMFIKKIYKFIDVYPDFIPSALNKKINTKVFPKLRKVLNFAKLEWSINIIKKSFFDQYIRILGNKLQKKKNPTMNQETRKNLIEFFKSPNADLEKLIDRNLDSWNKI